jgi:serine protease AprX
MAEIRSQVFRLSTLAVGILASGVALAEAQLDSQLLSRMAAVAPTEELQVVVSYGQSGPVTHAQLDTLRNLGIERGVQMQSLPIVGALATPAEIQALAGQGDVVSIYYNAPLRYFNKESRQISGAARVVENPADFGRAIPYSGRGVTVVVNDSGIDATNLDLQYGSHVVENVLAPQNILFEIAQDLTDTNFRVIPYLEGVINTDLGSGHGTHCAGTVGGSGAASNGEYRGVAPGADLVGYGSGGVLLILDAVGGLDYAATNQFSFDNPIRVTSNSWGSSGTFDPLNPVNIATLELHKRGIISVFAAGNDGPGEDTHNPYAQAPWVVSVGAGEKDGVLTSFSSRGRRGESGSFTMHDGSQWTYVNEPTIVATGKDIISTRALTGTLPILAATEDTAMIPPANLPYYTLSSGTSMATPHVAGILALMFEANPNLSSAQARSILKSTASNMTGRASWEVGAGHVNAYAAVAAAQGLQTGYGRTVNASRSFNANAVILPGGAPLPFAIDFAPVGPVESQAFDVGPDVAYVAARAEVGENTIALVLTDPDGVRYGSAITLPVLGETAMVGAPAKPGRWTITVRGIGSVSGVALDPASITNGYALPGRVSGQISFLNSGGYNGLDDIASHPARGAIEFGVANRLVDGYPGGKFRPNDRLRRSELAQFLVMGTSIRQSLPLNTNPLFLDLTPGSAAYADAAAVVASGAALRDLGNNQDGVMQSSHGRFSPTSLVTRMDLAYSLVQSEALQGQATAFTGDLTAYFDGKRVPVTDAASIPAGLRGYVQLALDLGLMNASFSIVQGPYALEPTVVASFNPGSFVTRAEYAVAASRYYTQFRSAED